MNKNSSSNSLPLPLFHRYRSYSDPQDITSQNSALPLNEQNYYDLIKNNIIIIIFELFIEYFLRILPILKYRFYYFILFFIILSLLIFGSINHSFILNNLHFKLFYYFLFQIFIINIFLSLLDELFFLFIDKILLNNEELRLYIHCLNGPLGFILTISIINCFLNQQIVPKSIILWNPIMSAIITIWTFYTIRKFYLRMNLNKLMITRFSNRIHNMKLDIKILSLLAHAIPRKSSEILFNEIISPPPPPPTHPPTSTSSEFNNELLSSTMKDTQNNHNIESNEISSKSNITKHFTNFIQKHRELTRTPSESSSFQYLSEIFSEIVENSHRASLLSSTSSSSNDLMTTTITTDETNNQQTSFWSQLAEVSNGSLVINTANGKLIIRSKRHAISFGKRLYTLLSRNDHKKITSSRISELIHRHITTEDNVQEIITRAQYLFNLPSELDEDYDTHNLTPQMINDVCISIYRSRKYFASSLSDFGELRKSLIAVSDILFWIIMLIIAQMIIKIDLTSIFAPLLTLIFAISFAVAPVVSNVFLAIGFVSFMLPYDIGDRVAIGTGSTRIIGNIERITLLQTTILTNYNEKLYIPNHSLFAEKITNLQQSMKAVLEIPISFTLTGDRAITKNQLNLFWNMLKNYILIEEKDNWIDLFIAGHTIDSINNCLGYSIWVTHRTSFGDVNNLYDSRTKLIEKIYLIKLQLGLHLTKNIQPIERTLQEKEILNSNENILREEELS